jgi:hypothetical protein
MRVCISPTNLAFIPAFIRLVFLRNAGLWLSQASWITSSNIEIWYIHLESWKIPSNILRTRSGLLRRSKENREKLLDDLEPIQPARH